MVSVNFSVILVDIYQITLHHTAVAFIVTTVRTSNIHVVLQVIYEKNSWDNRRALRTEIGTVRGAEDGVNAVVKCLYLLINNSYM
jgi:hypothetical protein